MATKIKKKTVRKPNLKTRRSTAYREAPESDGNFLLKLVVCVLLGAFWLRFKQPLDWSGITIAAMPIGLFIGLLIVHQFEKRQSDRKIWYATLIVVTIACAFAPTGIVL